MNKYLYRIIFNKKRGQMMVVAEHTTHTGKSPQDSSKGAALSLRPFPTMSIWTTGFVLLSGIGFAQAQIIADKNAPHQQRPIVLKNADGTPSINIQTPNDKGLSHNRYTQFDVGSKGAILNNSRVTNPHLSKGSARIILNEIRSKNPSKLNGVITVNGQRADVIIANPMGIQLNGGGVKNAHRTVLTTGTPMIQGGALNGFEIHQGTITVGTQGWNDGASYTEILSRAAAIQGKLNAHHLTLSTGPQKIDYETGEISNHTVTGTSPVVAIDTAALGSIYANSITLLANEKGIGVKNAGTLQAKQQLVVTSAGKIENSGNIRTTSPNTDNASTYLGLETIHNNAHGEIVSHTGKIESKGTLFINAGQDLNLNQTSVTQHDQVPAHMTLQAGRNLNIKQKSKVTNQGGSVHLAARANTLIQDAQIQAHQHLYSSSSGDGHLQANSSLTAGQDITVLTNKNLNSAAHITAKNGSIYMEAAQPIHSSSHSTVPYIQLNQGKLQAKQKITALADGNIQTRTGVINAADELTLQAGHQLNVTVDSALPTLANMTLSAGKHLTTKAMGNTQQQLTVNNHLQLTAGSLQTEKVNFKAQTGNLNLTARTGHITIGQNSRLESGNHTEIAALAGPITADGLTINALNGTATIMAKDHVNLYASNQHTNQIEGKQGVAIGAKGKLSAAQTNLQASAGNVHLMAGEQIIWGDGKQPNTITGQHITIDSTNNSVALPQTRINATKGALTIHAKQDITLANNQLSSAHNTIITTEQGKVHLNQVNARSNQHMSISSKSNQILQNHQQNSTNHLTARGILSVHSGWGNTIHNSQMQGGAINLTSQNSAIGLTGNTTIKAIANDVLKNHAQLRSTNGDINLEAKTHVSIAPGRTITADGDLTAQIGGKLSIAGKGGNKGNPSAQTATLTAKGNIHLVTGATDIQAATLQAGHDLTIMTTKEKLNIDAVKNTFKDYLPNHKRAELKRDQQILDKKINEVRKINSNDKRIAKWQAEKGHIDFYIQTIDKTVKGHKPKGHEHQQATLTGQNINLISAQGIEITGSDILANKQLNLSATGLLPKATNQTPSAILIDGTSDHYEIGLARFKSHYDVATLNKPSRLQGKQGINIQAPHTNPDARIIIQGSTVDAPTGNIHIKAYGDVLLTHSINDAYSFFKHKKKRGGVSGAMGGVRFQHDINHLIMPAPTELSAEKGIHIESGHNINAYSTQFYAPKGKTNLIAGEALNLISVEGKHHHHFETQKKTRLLGLTIKNKHYKHEELTHTATPVRINAQGVNTRSGWDTVLQGTEFYTDLAGANIQAGVGEKARSDAKIVLESIKTTIQTEQKKEAKSTVWQNMEYQGSVSETLALPQFSGPTPPKLSAPGGYIAEIPKGNLRTELEKLTKQPEYAYLKQLQTTNNVDWQQIQLAYQHWNYKQEGLTGAGAAIIALAVAVATAGVGAPIAAGAVGSAMQVAAIQSIAIQASIALANNKGNLQKTFKDLGSKQTIKQLTAAVATAGVAKQLNISAGLDNVNASSPFNERLLSNLITATSHAAINTTIHGGNLEEALKQQILTALVNTTHGEIASQIKYLHGEAWYEYTAHKLAHAIAGCAAAKASNGACRDGAIGAAVGEIVGEMLVGNKDVNTLTNKEREQIINYAKLAAGSVAALSGGNVDVAANAAETTVTHNTIAGDTIQKWLEEMRKYFRTEKEAKNNLDIIRNVAVEISTGTISGAVSTVDYGVDTLNAAVYCIGISPNYCNAARQTLKPKNQAIVNTFVATLDVNTYRKIALTLKRAHQGDKNAQEAVAVFVASSLGKKKPNVQQLDNYLVSVSPKSVPKKPQPQPNILRKMECSFRGDMQVRTQRGFLPIAHIQVGDMVWSRNPDSGKMRYQRVLNTINSIDPDTTYLTIVNRYGQKQTIVSDSKHPYFAHYGKQTHPPKHSVGKDYYGNIADAGWIDAGNLQPGYRLLDHHGQWQTVTNIYTEQQPLHSYNLEIETDHTFFIRGLGGQEGIWVHNANCWQALPQATSQKQVGNHQVFTFIDPNDHTRTVQVIQNPKWQPNSSQPEPKYIEVRVHGKKVKIVNEKSAHIIQAPGTIKIEPGEKGKWNPMASKPQPNLRYETTHGHIYLTDQYGRVRTVEADLKVVNPIWQDTHRNKNRQAHSGGSDRKPDDQGGHLIASIFEGLGEGINLVPMNGKLNGSSGEWNKIERNWRRELNKPNGSVKVKIEVIYPKNSNSKRPEEFRITETINGKSVDLEPLKNTATGK